MPNVAFFYWGRDWLRLVGMHKNYRILRPYLSRFFFFFDKQDAEHKFFFNVRLGFPFHCHKHKPKNCSNHLEIEERLYFYINVSVWNSYVFSTIFLSLHLRYFSSWITFMREIIKQVWLWRYEFNLCKKIVSLKIARTLSKKK